MKILSNSVASNDAVREANNKLFKDIITKVEGVVVKKMKTVTNLLIVSVLLNVATLSYVVFTVVTK